MLYLLAAIPSTDPDALRQRVSGISGNWLCIGPWIYLIDTDIELETLLNRLRSLDTSWLAVEVTKNRAGMLPDEAAEWIAAKSK